MTLLSLALAVPVALLQRWLAGDRLHRVFRRPAICPGHSSGTHLLDCCSCPRDGWRFGP